jgi:exopolysaccharide production protein ExoQ
MPPALATASCLVLIAFLFWLDRDSSMRTSGALWLPTTWLTLACSRSVSIWLQLGAPISSANQVSEGSPVDRVVYSALLAAGLIVLVQRRARLKGFFKANWAVILFFVYCGISIVWSDYPEVAIKRWPKAIGDLIMVLVVLSDANPLGALKRLFARIGYLLIPLSILITKYYPALGMLYGPWGGKPEYTGVTTNKNTLGMICLIFGLASLWRLIHTYGDREMSGRARRMAAQVLVLLMVVWLFRTADSMTSQNSFVMGSVLLLAANTSAAHRKPVVIHLLILFMLIGTISVLFLGLSPDALKTIGRDPTFTGRTEVWGVLLKLVKHPLVGTGFESFWLGRRLATIWEIYWWRPNEAHNGYLEVFLNLGWIGISGLALVLAVGYKSVVRRWRMNIPEGNLLLVYFFISLVFNLTEAAYFRMLAPVWISFLLAVTTVPLSARGTLFKATESPSRRLEQKQPAFTFAL